METLRLHGPLDVASQSIMNGWFTIVAALIAECFAGATVAAQPPDLPLSETTLGAVAEVREAVPRRFQSIADPLLDPLAKPELGLSEEWQPRCGQDDLTGETTSCWLDSPDYMPVGWEPDSSCHTRRAVSVGECALATFSDAIRISQSLTIYCDGRVRTEPLFTTSRFMVGNEVVRHDVRALGEIADDLQAIDDPETRRRLAEELDAAQTLFTSADGSWASKGTFAFEGTPFDETDKLVFRFVPDSSAIQEFLSGQYCAAEQ